MPHQVRDRKKLKSVAVSDPIPRIAKSQGIQTTHKRFAPICRWRTRSSWLNQMQWSKKREYTDSPTVRRHFQETCHGSMSGLTSKAEARTEDSQYPT